MQPCRKLTMVLLFHGMGQEPAPPRFRTSLLHGKSLYAPHE